MSIIGYDTNDWCINLSQTKALKEELVVYLHGDRLGHPHQSDKHHSQVHCVGHAACPYILYKHLLGRGVDGFTKHCIGEI